jgi:hypothetical protein
MQATSAQLNQGFAVLGPRPFTAGGSSQATDRSAIPETFQATSITSG